MLAVFKKEVAKCPEEVKNAEKCLSCLKEDLLLQHFSTFYPDSVTLNLAASGFMAFSSLNQNPLLPRYSPLFSFVYVSFFRYVCFAECVLDF